MTPREVLAKALVDRFGLTPEGATAAIESQYEAMKVQGLCIAPLEATVHMTRGSSDLAGYWEDMVQEWIRSQDA
jgi:hypothetical protein